MPEPERAILNRLFSILISPSKNVLVSGEANTGKTTLLRSLADDAVREAYLPDPARYLLVYLDCETLPTNLPSDQFWRQAFELLQEHTHPPETVSQTLQFLLKRKKIDLQLLEYNLEALGDDGYCLGLLLDNLEAMFGWSSSTLVDVLSGLRSLSSRSQALAVIIASCYTLSQLNEQTAVLNPYGSPFFNTYLEFRLKNK